MDHYEIENKLHKAVGILNVLMDAMPSDYEGDKMASIWAAHDLVRDALDEIMEAPPSEKESDQESEEIKSWALEYVSDEEDGSSIFKLVGEDAAIRHLVGSMFKHAILKGVTAADEESQDMQDFLDSARVIRSARKLEKLLVEWESSELIDYHPHVKEARVELSEAISKLASK